MPALRQMSGDKRWAARVRFYNGLPVIHFMNTAISAIPHPVIKDHTGNYILKDIDSKIKDNALEYKIDTRLIPVKELVILSPELGKEQRATLQQKKERLFHSQI